jgi:serine/threonine protein phosphatase PrpC
MGRVRKNNEDGLLVVPESSVAMVADGMGGAACGEIASALTLETVISCLRRAPKELSDEEVIKEAIREANRRVWDCARTIPDCEGMGSTIVLALWRLPHVLIANVGDSRGYLWRRGGLMQISYDQSVANELRMNLGLTEEQIRVHPQRNMLTMAIGTSENISICTRWATLEPGDQILLCSDGLTGPVSEETIAAVLGEPAPIQWAVENLIGYANENGGPDNVTAVLLRYVD